MRARREVILSAGAVGSPHLLMLSGIGPRRELESVEIPCQLDLPAVGKHLKDHLQVPMFFESPGLGVSMTRSGFPWGRTPCGAGRAIPADPARDEA